MEALRVARIQLHKGEEPCISGSCGSGTVFFSGCRLRCIFCQNEEISHKGHGETLTPVKLAGFFRELEERGAHNINLVTGEHFAEGIMEALECYRPKIPIVWNSSGYESQSTLRMLEPYVDVYLPDYKYADPLLAGRFSARPDYPSVALEAIREMLRQKGNPLLDEDGIIRQGVIIRHLVLPLHLKNTRSVLQSISENFPSAWVSLLLQYTPVRNLSEAPELNRKLTLRECAKAEKMLEEFGLENGYVQDLSASTSDWIPDFSKLYDGYLKE